MSADEPTVDRPDRGAGLVAEEGVNQQGTDAEAAGRNPAPDPAGDDDEPSGTGTPGAAATEGHGLLDAAPEPNEPA
jgi:hypothetical protein